MIVISGLATRKIYEGANTTFAHILRIVFCINIHITHGASQLIPKSTLPQLGHSEFIPMSMGDFCTTPLHGMNTVSQASCLLVYSTSMINVRVRIKDRFSATVRVRILFWSMLVHADVLATLTLS